MNTKSRGGGGSNGAARPLVGAAGGRERERVEERDVRGFTEARASYVPHR